MSDKPESPEETAVRILPCDCEVQRSSVMRSAQMETGIVYHQSDCYSRKQSAVAQAIRTAVAAEAQRWAPLSMCSAHQKPEPACKTCRATDSMIRSAVEAEREACADIASDEANRWFNNSAGQDVAYSIRGAIRARGEQEAVKK